MMYLVVRKVETSWVWVNLALKLIIGTLIVMAGGLQGTREFEEYPERLQIKDGINCDLYLTWKDEGKMGEEGKMVGCDGVFLGFTPRAKGVQ